MVLTKAAELLVHCFDSHWSLQVEVKEFLQVGTDAIRLQQLIMKFIYARRIEQENCFCYKYPYREVL